MTQPMVPASDVQRHLRLYDSIEIDAVPTRSDTQDATSAQQQRRHSRDLLSVSSSSLSRSSSKNSYGPLVFRTIDEHGNRSQRAVAHGRMGGKVKKKNLTLMMRTQRSTKNIQHLKRQVKIYLKLSQRKSGLNESQQRGVLALIRDLSAARSVLRAFPGKIPLTKNEIIYTSMDNAYRALPKGRERVFDWMLHESANTNAYSSTLQARENVPATALPMEGSAGSALSRLDSTDSEWSAYGASSTARTLSLTPGVADIGREAPTVDTLAASSPATPRQHGPDADYDSDDSASLVGGYRMTVQAEVHEPPNATGRRAVASRGMELNAGPSAFEQALQAGKKSLKRGPTAGLTLPSTPVSALPPPPPPPPSDYSQPAKLVAPSPTRRSASLPAGEQENGPPLLDDESAKRARFTSTSTLPGGAKHNDKFEAELAKRLQIRREDRKAEQESPAVS